ncbi:hypothetical protein N182_11745 [Sinorhizobium sp. GL2]|nr:hypothetical protein N182_11745 [Sinorhizobium sp. GL2]
MRHSVVVQEAIASLPTDHERQGCQPGTISATRFPRQRPLNRFPGNRHVQGKRDRCGDKAEPSSRLNAKGGNENERNSQAPGDRAERIGSIEPAALRGDATLAIQLLPAGVRG